jgi:hypothetical protein
MPNSSRRDRHHLPIRSPQHISETESSRLFQEQLPSSCIVRNLTERDYGVDVLVELTDRGRMTGSMIAGQIKSVANFNFAGRQEKGFSGLKRSTYNYLLGLPVPTYLFICSLKDRQVYWANVREHDRQRRSDEGARPIFVINQASSLSSGSWMILELTALRERRWPQVENAIVGGLMFFNALGPLFLACKRAPPNSHAPSAVQFLLIQHYEYNQLIYRYVINTDKKFRPLPELYAEAVKRGSIGLNGTFTVGFVTEVFQLFLSDYYSAIQTCFHTVMERQRTYWSERYPYLNFHLRAYPPLFNETDWFARFYFDEYERETRHINLRFIADLDSTTYDNLSPR